VQRAPLTVVVLEPTPLPTAPGASALEHSARLPWTLVAGSCFFRLFGSRGQGDASAKRAASRWDGPMEGARGRVSEQERISEHHQRASASISGHRGVHQRASVRIIWNIGNGA